MFYVYLKKDNEGSYRIEISDGQNSAPKGAAAIFEFEDMLAAKRHEKMLKTYDKDMLGKIVERHSADSPAPAKRAVLKKKDSEGFTLLDKILGR